MGTGTDADKFEKFYNAIIKKLQANNISVYLCTPAAIGERTDFSNQLDGDLNKYSSIIRTLPKTITANLLICAKTFLITTSRNNKENKEEGILTSDRVHLNEKGNTFVAEKMLKAIFKRNCAEMFAAQFSKI